SSSGWRRRALDVVHRSILVRQEWYRGADMPRHSSVNAVIVLTVSAVASGPATGSQPPPQDPVRAFADAVNRPLVYHVPGEDRVRFRRDLVYRADPEAKADIYLPPPPAAAGAPIVVFIHGGVPAVPVRPKD